MAKVKNSKNEVKEQPIEQVLWAAADKLRKNMDAAEYKHVVLGLIFLKYISDSFYDLYYKLKEGKGEYEGADPDDPYEYRAENVFYVPPQARWDYLQSRAKLPTIGKDIDEAMEAVEKDNPSLKGVLPKEYAKEKLDKQSLGGLIDLIGTIALGDSVSKSSDILGQVYEYFLGQFALAEGKKGGQFYTPRSVVRLLVEMLEPYEGRVFDIIIPKLIQFNDFRKLLLKGVQILLRGCIMKSDHWLQLNYKHGKSIWASDIVHYYYWYDDENKPVGISLNFEYADDFHYDIAMEEWGKAARLLSINEDLNNTEECLKTFFSGHSRMFDFEEFLQSNEIKFSKIALY